MQDKNQLTFDGFHPTFFFNQEADETLYSLIARYHKISGFSKSSITSNSFFGFPRAAVHAGIPMGLQQLKLALSLKISSREILRSQTIAGLYLPFLNADNQSHFIGRRELAPLHGIPNKLGLTGSRILLAHPLKYCPHCVESDQIKFGFSYWHLQHQYPGIWICSEHHSPLQKKIRTKSEEVEWITAPNKSEIFTSCDYSVQQKEFLIRLSEIVHWFVSIDCIDVGTLKHLVSTELLDQGISNSSTEIDHSTLSQWAFKAISCQLPKQNDEFTALKNEKWVYELVIGNSIAHPIQWALILTALFTVQDLNHKYKHTSDPQVVCKEKSSSQEITFPTISSELFQDIYIVLGTGCDIQRASKNVGISRQTLYAILATDSDLSNRWLLAKQENLRSKNRQSLISLIDRTTIEIRSESLSSNPKLIRWLVKNDLPWLQEVLARYEQPASTLGFLF